MHEGVIVVFGILLAQQKVCIDTYSALCPKEHVHVLATGSC